MEANNHLSYIIAIYLFHVYYHSLLETPKLQNGEYVHQNEELLSQEIKKPSSILLTFLQYSEKQKWHRTLFLHKTTAFWGGPISKYPVKQASTRFASQVSHREVPEQKAIKVPFFPSLRNAPKMKSTSKLISFQQNISLLANRRVVTKNF